LDTKGSSFEERRDMFPQTLFFSTPFLFIDHNTLAMVSKSPIQPETCLRGPYCMTSFEQRYRYSESHRRADKPISGYFCATYLAYASKVDSPADTQTQDFQYSSDPLSLRNLKFRLIKKNVWIQWKS
jgi:hypothetical protein